MKNERIMIVEDDQILAEHVRSGLNDWGYVVDAIVEDGEGAVREAERKKPNLVLMDIQLKGAMSGITASEIISGRLNIPVVFISAPEDEALVKKTRLSGARGYLLKPIDDRILKITVENALYRHKIEEAFSESEKRYRGIIEGMAEGYYEANLAGYLTFINEAMAQIVGLPKEQLVGKNNRDFMEPNTAKLVYKKFNEVYRTGDPVEQFAFELKTKEGRSRYLELSIGPIKNRENRPIGFRGIARDITEKRKTEVSLIETRNFLQNILNSSIDGICTTDMKGKIIFATPSLQEMLGFDQKELIGKRVYDLYKNGKQDAKHIMGILTHHGGLKNHEMQFVAKDGRELHIMLSASMLKEKAGNPIGTLGIFKDITEKKQMEEQILQSQKHESIGVLAGGIAHDFNNLLTAVVGNISLARMYAKAEGKLAQVLNEADRACGQAKELTERLLNVSPGDKPVKKVDAIGRLMQDVTVLVLSGSTVSNDFDVPADLWLVEYNTDQMKEVFANIVLNAVESMPKGGLLRVKGRNVLLDRKRVDTKEVIAAGRYVQLSFTDNGVGIPEENLQKIFDPYFSTKEQGIKKGTGLGLTTVYSIIKKHGGHIHIESKEGSGTTVHIFLPAYGIRKRGAEGIVKLGEATERPKGKILLMDDEEIVREVVGEMLKEMGYTVKFAKEGSEAVELYHKAKGAGAPFEAVILDVTVKAGMGGKETLKCLLEIDPDVKAFVSSGYSNEPIMLEYQKYGFIGAIAKPFSIETLKAAIEEKL